MENVLICDGAYEIVKITENLYDQAIKLYVDYFMKYENISRGANLLGTKHSIDEMIQLIRNIFIDGISFAARDRATNELIAMSCNKIFSPAANCTLAEACEDFTSPEMLCVCSVLDRMESSYNIYNEWDIDCVMEIVFLSTRSDYSGKGLATILSRHSIEYALKMKDDLLTPEEKATLPLHVRDLKPQAITSVFTSRYSQNVGNKLGFQTLYKVPFSEFCFNGKSFTESIEPIHEFCTFAALRI